MLRQLPRRPRWATKHYQITRQAVHFGQPVFYIRINRIITPVKNNHHFIKSIFLFVLTLLLVTSCGNGNTPDDVQQAQELTPTATEAPMAARVNGEGILLSDFEQELQRYQAAASAAQIETSPEEAKQVVLDYLIDRILLVQAARENGYTPSEALVSQKIEELSQTRDGQQDLNTFLAENFYSEESFRSAIEKELAVIWMRNFIVDQVPAAVEQVHARQILVNTENEAIAIMRRLEVGTPFSELAFEVDPLTGGELGWFPRGYLFQPAVEEAAFALQSGQYSGMVETDFGYHIIEVIERDPQRELKGGALQNVQRSALETWLADRRAQSAVEIYVN